MSVATTSKPDSSTESAGEVAPTVRLFAIFFPLIFLLILPTTALASPKPAATRARYSISVSGRTFDSERISRMALGAKRVMAETLDELNHRFESKMRVDIEVRFLPRREFLKTLSSPFFVTALYSNGTITVPIGEDVEAQDSRRHKALRHEFTHAFVDEMSGGKCPAWLDEGIAQFFSEGAEKLSLRSLSRRLRMSGAFGLSQLENDLPFSDIGSATVAYSEALLASKLLISRFGYLRIKRYLISLRRGKKPRNAFRTTFGISLDDFEKDIYAKVGEFRVITSYGRPDTTNVSVGNEPDIGPSLQSKPNSRRLSIGHWIVEMLSMTISSR